MNPDAILAVAAADMNAIDGGIEKLNGWMDTAMHSLDRAREQFIELASLMGHQQATPAPRLIMCAAIACGVPTSIIRSKRKPAMACFARWLVMEAMREQGLKDREIAPLLKMERSTVPAGIASLRRDCALIPRRAAIRERFLMLTRQHQQPTRS